MKKYLWLTLLLVSFMFGSVGHGQQEGDVDRHDIDPRVASGPPRRAYILRVPEADTGKFLGVVQRFADMNGFIHIRGLHGLRLSDHVFGDDWYTRPDGVTLYVTNITAPEEMRVIFYNREDGAGIEQAGVMGDKLRHETAQWRDYQE